MSLRLLPLILLLSLAVTTAGAQVLRLPTSRDPAFWGSLGLGLHQAQSIVDGSNSTRWDFANSIQYRGTLEKDIRGHSTLGLSVSTAQMPLRYTRLAPAPDSPCPTGCDATANVYTAMALFSAGGGQGFSQLLQIGAGFNHYTNFREDATGAGLEPGGDTDFAFTVGYGFAYGLGARSQIFLMQDAGYSLHQREGLGGNQSSASQQLTTRLGVRVGMGARGL